MFSFSKVFLGVLEADTLIVSCTTKNDFAEKIKTNNRKIENKQILQSFFKSFLLKKSLFVLIKTT